MEKKALIMRLAVHPEHRRKGIGSMLVESGLERLAKMGILEVEADVEVAKPGVMRLCEKMGFKVTKAVPTNHDANNEVYVMKLRLNARSHAA
jgi:ribosomal protein S18 acetylase RimI-like enzyme